LEPAEQINQFCRKNERNISYQNIQTLQTSKKEKQYVQKMRIGPQVLVFYRNLLNLKLLFKNQKKLKLSPVFK